MEIEKLKRKDSKEKEDEIQKIEEDESTVLDFSVKNDQEHRLSFLRKSDEIH